MIEIKRIKSVDEITKNMISNIEKSINDQTIKADAGKPRLSLVPAEMITSAAKIIEYDINAEANRMPKLLYKTGKQGHSYKAMFECPFCGKEFEANISNVMGGKTRSCGCAKGKLLVEAKGTHGETRTRLYRIYTHILDRCNNPKCKEYKWYGAKGIKCEFKSYYEFREFATENGYADDLTIERMDVNGNYSKENCTFIPLSQQARNTTRNVKLTYKGITLCAAEWAEILGINQDTITSRKRKGWSDEKNIETPVHGSLDIKLVPPEIINAILSVRRFGLKKYNSSENWRAVDTQRYRDAAYRHLVQYLDNPKGNDIESGLPSLWHLACNVAFLCELEDFTDE